MGWDQSFLDHWRALYYEDLSHLKSFSFTDEGATSSKELNKAMELFSSKKNWDQNNHPQCLFPARYLLMNKFLKNPIPKSLCPDFDEWMNKLSPEGISVVFAGNYPDNPGSIFGHTFLKLKSKKDSYVQMSKTDRSEILDYALNYAAVVDDENELFYAMKGLFGGYPGSYSMGPYYMKVNEYGEGEGRDLWEYEINLTPKESAFLLAHFWELKYHSAFRYFFLDDNCSYLILRLLHATRPDWNLLKDQASYVIPLETVKILKTKTGVIKNLTFRPSIRKKAQDSYRSLDFSEKDEVLSVLGNKEKTSTNPKVLNTVILNLYSKKSKNNFKLSDEDEKILSNSLVQLSQLDTSHLQKTNPEKNEQQDPVKSHNVAQIGSGFGEMGGKIFTLFKFRPGLHDQTDDQTGHLPFSELTVFDTELNIFKDQVFIQKIDLFNLGLLRPVNLGESSLSWRFHLNYQGNSQLYCKDCKKMFLDTIVGYSLNPFESGIIYLMGGVFVDSSGADGSLFRGGAEGELGFIHEVSSKFRTLLKINSFVNLMNKSKYMEQTEVYTIKFSNHYNFTKDLELNAEIMNDLFSSGALPSRFIVSMDYHF